MKRALLLFILALSSVSLFSQRNFKPATITFQNGDTAHGEINYQNWRINPSTILFRKDAASKPVSYGPETLASFSVENDTYKGAAVYIDDRFDDMSRLTFEDKIITRKDTLFLEEIVGGKNPSIITWTTLIIFISTITTPLNCCVTKSSKRTL